VPFSKAFLLIERYNDPKVSVLRFLSVFIKSSGDLQKTEYRLIFAGSKQANRNFYSL
jgi:hypothetical protein